MNDEATLTIRFKDESSPGPAGVATTSPQYSGSDPGSAKVADTQNAITQAGGAGQWAARNNQASTGGAAMPVPSAQAAAVPSASIAVGDPLSATVRGLVQADPSVTAAELQQALGVNAARAQSLLNAASGGASPAATAAQSAAGAGATTAQGVQKTVGQLADIAAQGGPLGAAAGRAATAAAAIPGVGSALAAAVPAAAAAAPFLAAGAAALAVPAAAAATVNSILNTVQSQVGGLSPELAQAQADAMVRQLLSNRRTAEILGDEAAQDVSNRSRIRAASQGLRDIAVEPLLQHWNDATEQVARANEKANEVAQRGKEDMQRILDREYHHAADSFVPFGGFFLDLMRKLNEADDKERKPLSLLNIIPSRPQLPPPFTSSDPRAKVTRGPGQPALNI